MIEFYEAAICGRRLNAAKEFPPAYDYIHIPYDIVWIILGKMEFGEGVGDRKVYFPAANPAPNTILYVCGIQN